MPIFKKVNKNFFKVWAPGMAYILGFFAADGYITVNKKGGGFWCLDIKDKKLLEQIKVTIQAEHKISTRKRVGGKYITYRLQIGSIEMCNDLQRLGFSARKTRNLSISSIPHEYFKHFVRGYFDGDGNVWCGLIHKDKEHKTQSFAIQVVFTSCSPGFLEELKDKLENFGILQGRIRKGNGDYFRLVYSINNTVFSNPRMILK